MKQRTVFITVTIMLVIACAGIISTWYFVRSRSGAEAAVKFIVPGPVAERDSAAAVMPAILGFDHPRIVLFLFLNNMELRPGGGFIGSYGIGTLDHGVIHDLKTDGTENLDHKTPESFFIEPPKPLQQHLIGRWFFRDSNWSPDFSESAKKALQFYAAEGGERADHVETVIGITPAVLETVLKYTGPIQEGGKTYTAETISDLLEYTVEIEYADKKIPASQRKKIISDLAKQIAERAVLISPRQWGPLISDLFGLITHGQVMLYDVNPDVQKTLVELGWAGRVKEGAPDFLMQVDANLASLKTDRVIDRALAYSIFRDAQTGEVRATVTSTYKNNGSFDWRTSRYGTYTRWLLPLGTKFISGGGSQKDLKSTEPAPWDITEELGHTSIGTFLVVEPGAEKTITFTIALAPQVVADLNLGGSAAGHYGLLVQKELGVKNFQLTIHHNFGKSVGTAEPAESPDKFGDAYYDWTGTVDKEQKFLVNF